MPTNRSEEAFETMDDSFSEGRVFYGRTLEIVIAVLALAALLRLG